LGLSSERSALGISKTRVYYPKEEKGKYLAYKLLIHTSFIIPVFLVTFLLYYLFNIRLRNESLKVVMWGYMVFAFWMIAHLVIEVLTYIWQQFPNAGVYLVLIILAVIFTLLAIFIQKKVAEHHHV
jgi:magnesium-transporting ATPase (P-type)